MSDNTKVEYAFQSGGKTKVGPKSKRMKMDVPQHGEDEVSFARHNSRLKAESSKPNPNRGIIRELMGITYSMRHEDITHNPRNLGELLKHYPFLGNPEEVCLE